MHRDSWGIVSEWWAPSWVSEMKREGGCPWQSGRQTGAGFRARLEGAGGRMRSSDPTVPAKAGWFVHSRAVRRQIGALEDASAPRVHGWGRAEMGVNRPGLSSWHFLLCSSSPVSVSLLVLDISLPRSLFPRLLSSLVPLTRVKRKLWGPFPRSCWLLS